MKRAIYPGSFDPITFGHVDIIARVLKHVDELHVVVAENPKKEYWFTAEERAGFILESIRELNPDDVKRVQVSPHVGLISDYARAKQVNLLVRGIRAVSDFETEMAMANMNRTLNRDLETLIIFASPKQSHVASRLVKEVARFGGDLSELVPKAVADALEKKFRKSL